MLRSFTWFAGALVLVAAQAAYADSVVEMLDHHRIPPGVKVPAVQTDYNLGDDPYNSDCAVRALRVHFYSPDDQGLAQADFGYLMPKSAGSHDTPVILILPNTYGATAVEGDLAGALCRSGFAVTFPDGKRGFPDDLSEVNAFLREEVIVNRTLIDFLQKEPEINPAKIGVAGVSYGAIVSGILVAAEPRIKAAMILGGAADLPNVLATSDNDVVANFRHKQMSAHGLRTAADYEAALRQVVVIDAVNPALNARAQSSKILQYVIIGDTTVPNADQVKLWQALGQPRRIDLTPGLIGSHHISAILSVITGRLGEVADFFHSKL